jgi:inner membrane protein
MLNSTHTLVGLALARTRLGSYAPHATWTAAIASNLPDIDIVYALAGTATYVDHHRGITHAIAGIPVLALLLALLMQRIFGARLWDHYVVALTAMATHPLLDWMNAYGVRPFLPFSGTWYYGDALFVIDPYLDCVLAAGLLASLWLSRRKGSVIALTFALAVAYVGSRVILRDIARDQLAAVHAESSPVRVAVIPEMLNPLAWTGLAETEREVLSYRIDLAAKQVEPTKRFPRASLSDVIDAAVSTYTGGVFWSFARFPITDVVESADGYRVKLLDVRFLRARRTVFGAEIVLDRSLAVQEEMMSFTLPFANSPH